ncbi:MULTISPECIES: hypothetical protein [Metallosphaera]|uniref:Uncharacterized protein n=3 Tax=Metallosphaera TaxID=41980 RepID=A4YGC2_METS5|nr:MULTISPECIES: hypothetical protein [Metallosphaera]ABP95474.1 hypothetical protein Msed_1316 [Metallosphaera sedula DSM 5348]AIM27459.1 hypothetical protein HA72_1316 [Metallosphaera sedula]MCY0861614.1 hypothetical protein [Metallosphaera prunae]QCO31078.1 hypothetical protein DFR88_11740 [Metallosphaera prunae]WPX05324.1 hypothetical protein SOJ17_001292 [Metallosphaera sedula DSM 5348]
MIVDIQHVGIRGYERDLGLDLVLLNPSYRLGCQCCVDGFYQQYLWSRGRKGYIQLGIYNPRCRVPVEVELERQIRKGIVGVVLNPANHGYSLREAKRTVEYVNRKRLNLYLYTRTLSLEELEELNDGLDVKLVILDPREEISPLSRESNVYFNVKDYSGDLPSKRAILATFYPYESEKVARELLSRFSWTFDNLLELVST